MRAGPPAAAPRARLAWVDVAKGIGILLVVAGHVLAGLVDGGILPRPDWFRPLLLLIYLFHMPLFFFLSGLFIAERIARGRTAFLRQMGKAVVWPFFLWSIVQSLIAYAAAGYTNTPVDDLGAALAGILVEPPAQFWFLYALFLCQVLSLLCLRAVGGFGFMLVSAALFGAGLLDLGLPSVLDRTAHMLPFFALGAWFGRQPRLMAPPLAGLPTAGLGILAAVAIWLCYRNTVGGAPGAGLDALHTNDIVGLAWTWWNLPAALLGTAAAIALSVHMPRGLAAGLAYLGSRSMAIFVLHILAIVGARIASVRLLGFEDPATLAVLLTIIGVAAPVVAAEIARRLGWHRFLAI